MNGQHDQRPEYRTGGEQICPGGDHADDDAEDNLYRYDPVDRQQDRTEYGIAIQKAVADDYLLLFHAYTSILHRHLNAP